MEHSDGRRGGREGGQEDKKAGRKYGTVQYLAMWQGLRGEDLDIDLEGERLAAAGRGILGKRMVRPWRLVTSSSEPCPIEMHPVRGKPSCRSVFTTCSNVGLGNRAIACAGAARGMNRLLSENIAWSRAP